eukprot:jgi/Mesvir1/16873/Mv15757-RA.1
MQINLSLSTGRMALWCRKCIYLKPKLEKLAAEEYPHVPFYCVDVNAVPAKVSRELGGIQMPTIQLWMGKEKKEELIAGEKGFVVMDKVREMLHKHGVEGKGHW